MSYGLRVRRPGVASVESSIPDWPEALLWAKTGAKYWDQVNPQTLSPKS